MERIVSVGREDLEVAVYPVERIVSFTLHGYVFGAPLREAMLAGVDLMRRYNAKRWLSDYRDYETMSIDDVEWIHNQLDVARQATGWSHFAVVMPRSAIGRMNLGDVLTRYASIGISVASFDSLREAICWLSKHDS